MSKTRKATVDVKGTAIAIMAHREADYISLTDIARHKNAGLTDDLIRNWLRNRNTIEFLGIWESLNNPGFNPVEFDGFRKSAGLNSFALTPRQWIEKTGAVGILSKAGRYGGTDVALFGHTAREWRDANPDKKGNVRDFATIEQLLVLANIESMNAELIHTGIAQGARLQRLNEIAIRQMRVLTATPALKQLKG